MRLHSVARVLFIRARLERRRSGRVNITSGHQYYDDSDVNQSTRIQVILSM